MNLVVLLLVLTLIFDVLSNNLTIGILADRVGVVAAGPKTAAPKNLPDLGMQRKQTFRRYALDGSAQLAHGNIRDALHQKVNMVGLVTDFQKVNLITIRYALANRDKTIAYLRADHRPTILQWKNQVIQQERLAVPFMNMFTHYRKGTLLQSVMKNQPFFKLFLSTPGQSPEEF